MGSPADTEPVMTCEECGASVLAEHLSRGLAGMWGGHMLCPPCLRELKEADQSRSASEPGPGGASSEEAAGAAGGQASTRAVAEPGIGASHDLAHYRRPLNATGQGATRLQTFHARLSEGAVGHLDQQINAWLDSHPEIEVKFATSTVGVWEGKHGGPCLILTVFY